MKSMAIVIRDDSFDKIMVPLAFAHAQAQKGELSEQDIVDAVWFLDDKAQTADHCAYF